MRFPQAYNRSGPSSNALKLKKTLYGLKQLGCKWWEVLGEALNQIGFKQCENKWGMYILPSSDVSPRIILLAYVDDLVLAARTVADIDSVLSSLAEKWVISKLGLGSHILGTKITQSIQPHPLAHSDSVHRFAHAAVPRLLVFDRQALSSAAAHRCSRNRPTCSPDALSRARRLSPLAFWLYSTRCRLFGIISLSICLRAYQIALAASSTRCLVPCTHAYSWYYPWRQP